MSTQEVKKAKRRKNKAATGKYSTTSAVPQTNEITEMTEDNTDAERIARLMDAPDDETAILHFDRGTNPYLDRQKCLLCGVDKTEPSVSGSDGSVGDEGRGDIDGHTFEQIAVWVCQTCRQTTDVDMNRKFDLSNVAEIPMSAIGMNPGQDLGLDSTALSMLGDFSFANSLGEPLLTNGSLCNCPNCIERRQIVQEMDQETKTLQDTYVALRTTVRSLYSKETTSLSEENATTLREQVDKLCSRDPHQLYKRLENLVREFVIEKKANLRNKINEGYDTPPKAKEIMSMLLDEYYSLSDVARLVAENLSTLNDFLDQFHVTKELQNLDPIREHLGRFNVTWELDNKHLYHSMVYNDPTIHGCLDSVCEQLRNGALDKESYTEDTYPNLMKKYVGFRNEMSVIAVLWNDCQQLIDRYNEEQAALKVKQKWLKEDWEFFKQQRKILEQQVLKNNPKASVPHSMEAQFTETMRNMLTGQKPIVEESHCPRCSRKRCPCDECTITHMITCGIINPEQLETNGTHHTFNFPHDSNRYIIDVTPPSMSSTTSSSPSSSPVPVSRAEMATHHLNSCALVSENNTEPDENSRRLDEGADNVEEEAEGDCEDKEDDDADNEAEDDDDDEEEEEEEDDDDDDDREEEDDEGDADEEDDEDEEEEEEEDEDDEDQISAQDQKDLDELLASEKLGSSTAPLVVQTAENWKLFGSMGMCQQHHLAVGTQQIEEPLELSSQDFPDVLPPTCPCPHCCPPVTQENTVQAAVSEESLCDCHICQQQRGQTVSMALPTSLPAPPRPAQLHLYPHIHGTLPQAPHPHLHLPHTTHPTHSLHPLPANLLQPQLYNLHCPRLTQMPLKLDHDDPDAFQDHLMNAYDDWENTPTVDASRFLGAAHHNSRYSDLPIPSSLTVDPPFPFESLSAIGTHCHSLLVPGSLGVTANGASAFKTVTTGFSSGIPPAFQVPVDPSAVAQDHSPYISTASSASVPSPASPSSTSMAQQMVMGKQELNLNFSTPLSLSSLNFSTGTPASLSLPLAQNPPPPPPCTRPATLGGNAGMQPSPTGKEQRTYAQPCKKYTSGAHTSRQAAVGKNGVAPPPPPPSSQGADSPSFNIGNLQAGNAVKAPGKLQQRHANGDVPHRCPHEHIVSLNGRRENHDDHGNLSSCASAMANCAGNVSVGTSTLCQDPDCHSHHDDNCDSIDDSGSEKSSSTSTSNQKEGKFCDCYYCEFLGHGNTQMTQTSKNLAEIRERLRKRLKQKNEAAAKQEHGGCHELQVANHKAISQKVNTKNLDELLSFINGTDSDGAKAGSQPSSSKAAKKARQKQRKLDEKIRKEEEERRQKQAQEAAEEAAKALAASKSNNNQKKKGKHKEQQKQQHKPASSSTTASNNPSPAPKPDATLRESTGKGKATEVEEKAVNNSNSHQVDKSKPSTPQAPTAVPSTKVSSVPAKVDSAPQPATVTAGLKHTADTPAASVASPANPPRLLTKANLKSAEVFQPPAHLMRSLAEQTMQQQQQATSAVAGTTNTAVPSTSIFNTSPTGLPTLGNQPNSPTAKKAKRRLGPAGSAGQLTAQRKLLINTPISAPEGTQLVEAQRRLEAQQDVAKQMKEAHEYAQQQSQLRQQFIQQQQQAQSQQQTVSSQPQPQDPKKPSNAPSACQADFQQQLLKMQQLKQQHLKQQQQKVLAQKQGPVPRQAAPASSTGKQHSPAPAPNQQQQPHVKVSANGVAGHHVALSNNHHSKVAVAEVGRAASSQNAAPANAVNWSQSGHKTQLQDTNGLATLLLGPGVHEMPQRRAVSQQEIIDAGARNARGKNKKKKKANQDTRAVDEVFMPNPDAELDSNDMDEADRDIEKFKRFVMENPTPPKERKKLDVTLNMKDIFSKKKSGLGCA